METGKAMLSLRLLVVGFSPLCPKFDPRSCHVGFVVNKMAMRKVFSKYFDLPCCYEAE
jgi:hypothetical protein